MRNSITLLELKHGKKLDDIIESLPHYDYNNLVSRAIIFFKDLFSYLKAIYLSEPNMIFPTIFSTSLIAGRKISQSEINFLSEVIYKSGVEESSLDEIKAQANDLYMKQASSTNLNSMKKSLFSFAKYLSQDDLPSLVGFLSCLFLCDGTIGAIERKILFNIFEVNQRYI